MFTPRTGKSALVMRGIREPARKMGLAFAGGKFDLNRSASVPLSAFAEAAASLAQSLADGDGDALSRVRRDVDDEFPDVNDKVLLAGALPGCEGLLFPQHGHGGSCLSAIAESLLSHDSILGPESFLSQTAIPEKAPRRWSAGSLRSVASTMSRLAVGSYSVVGGKDTVMRLQYAIRRLLRAICKNLKGVVLFIDDLQWSDVATIELLKSIALDRDIPSLLLVGAYRADEVSA